MHELPPATPLDVQLSTCDDAQVQVQVSLSNGPGPGSFGHCLEIENCPVKSRGNVLLEGRIFALEVDKKDQRQCHGQVPTTIYPGLVCRANHSIEAKKRKKRKWENKLTSNCKRLFWFTRCMKRHILELFGLGCSHSLRGMGHSSAPAMATVGHGKEEKDKREEGKLGDGCDL